MQGYPADRGRPGPYPQDLHELVEEGFGEGAIVNILRFSKDGSLRTLDTNVRINNVDELGFTHRPTEQTVSQRWAPHEQIVRGEGAYAWGSVGFDSLGKGWINIEVISPGLRKR